MRLRRILPRITAMPVCGLLFGWIILCAGLSDEKSDADLIEKLLALRAPIPDWREQLVTPEFAIAPSPPPAEDAPLEALVEFWCAAPEKDAPSAGIRARLQEACEAQPALLADLLRWLPTDAPDVHDRIKALYDRVAEGGDPKIPVERIHRWLMVYSRYFRDELLAGAREAIAGPDGSATAAQVEALSKLDPQAAEKLLLPFVADRNSYVRARALYWLLETHKKADDARATEWRAEWQKIAVSKTALASARDLAIRGLMEIGEWPGREKWFLGLFRDASLWDLKQENSAYSPLGSGMVNDPEFWIPKVAALVGSPNRAMHNNAVNCLAGFSGEHARADALRPLLPWLTDAKWAKERWGNSRLEVVQSISSVDLPESVPGMRWVLEHEREFFATAAAKALARHHVTEARDALKAAIKRETEDSHRRSIIEAAFAMDAFSMEEMVQALEAYATTVSTMKGSEESQWRYYDTNKTPKVSVGLELAGLAEPPAGLGAAVLRRCEEIAANQPEAVERLHILATSWGGPAAAELAEKRLRTGDLTVDWLLEVLDLRSDVAPRVRKIEGLHGLARGVQAAIVGENLAAVLRGEDRNAQLGLLACARQARIPLPLDVVEPMFESDDGALARASEQYLISEDSPRARATVLRHYPGQARILGPFMSYHADFYTPHQSGNDGTLQQMFRGDDPPQEIFALFSNGEWGDDGQRIVAIYPGKAVFTHLKGEGKSRVRTMEAGEVEKLRTWIASHRADDLAPYKRGAADGIDYEYVHLTPNGGRRVFMENPPGRHRQFTGFFPGRNANEPDPRLYGELVEQFLAFWKDR